MQKVAQRPAIVAHVKQLWHATKINIGEIQTPENLFRQILGGDDGGGVRVQFIFLQVLISPLFYVKVFEQLFCR